jgi:hypothetical protein
MVCFVLDLSTSELPDNCTYCAIPFVLNLHLLLHESQNPHVDYQFTILHGDFKEICTTWSTAYDATYCIQLGGFVVVKLTILSQLVGYSEFVLPMFYWRVLKKTKYAYLELVGAYLYNFSAALEWCTFLFQFDYISCQFGFGTTDSYFDSHRMVCPTSLSLLIEINVWNYLSTLWFSFHFSGISPAISWTTVSFWSAIG